MHPFVFKISSEFICGLGLFSPKEPKIYYSCRVHHARENSPHYCMRKRLFCMPFYSSLYVASAMNTSLCIADVEACK